MSSSHAPRSLRPLRSARYRLLGGALALNLAGAGMWLVASAWQVIALGAGPAALGLVATGSTLALVAAALLGGVVADRVSRRSVIAWTQAAMAAGVARRRSPSPAGSACSRRGTSSPRPGCSASPAASSTRPTRHSSRPSRRPHRDDLLAVNGLEKHAAAGPHAGRGARGRRRPRGCVRPLDGVRRRRRGPPRGRGVRPGRPPRRAAGRGGRSRATPCEARWWTSAPGSRTCSARPGCAAACAALAPRPRRWSAARPVAGPVQVLVRADGRADGGTGGVRDWSWPSYGAGGLVGSLVMSLRVRERRPRRAT